MSRLSTPDSQTANDPVQSPGGKKVVACTIANFIVPGLGLAMLGRWGLGLVNFALANVVLGGCLKSGEPKLLEHIHWVWFVIAIGSASLAHSLAMLRKEQSA